MKKAYVAIMVILFFTLSAPAELVNRYSFTDGDTVAVDSAGGQNGTLEGGAVITDNAVVIGGGTAYVNLPAAVLSDYTTATIETWFTLNAATGWQRLFDFGDTSGINGGYYWFYSPTSGNSDSRLVISTGDFPGWQTGENFVAAPIIPVSTPKHVVCIYDETGPSMSIYEDGEQVASGTVTMSLADVHRTFAYIGASVYPGDPHLNGTVDEFRIYDSVLLETGLLLNRQLGADKYEQCVIESMSPDNEEPFVAYDPVTSLSWTVDPAITNVDYFDIYLSTDPNVTDPNYALDNPGAYSPYYTTTDTSYDVSGLVKDTQYFWRIDTVTTDPNTYVGPAYTFFTAPDEVIITNDPDDYVVPLEQTTASFTIVAANATSYAWYKVGNATPLAEGAKYSDAGTASLTINDVEVADEGQYYCVASNGLPSDDTSESAYLWTSRLMGHWKFDGNMLDSVADTVTVAPAHDGSIVVSSTVTGPGDPNYVSEDGGSGISGNAMKFNNDGDYVEIPESAFFNFYPQGLTISGWYQMGTSIGWRLPICKLDAGIDGWLFGIGDPEIQFIIETGGAAMYTGADVDYGDGQWHLMTATYTPSDTTIRLYADGVYKASKVINLAVGYGLPVAPLNIGGRDTEASISGAMDDVRIYSYPLTATEVALLYTDMKTSEYICVTPEGQEALGAADLTGDCRVTMDDFVEMAIRWLECQRVPTSSCEW